METRLNTDRIREAMRQANLTPAAVGADLGVSKSEVMQWLKHDAYPAPAKLLNLANLLGLGYEDTVILPEEAAPIVAFRRRRGTRTRPGHIKKAQDMGRLLRHLVDHLPGDVLPAPPVLKAPAADYGYLQQAASMVRAELCVHPESVLDFHHLIDHFLKLQAVLIPVLWGNRERHGNALHIHLPDSRTTWVYLNLDVNIHDFKFWMAHEMGHCLSPSLMDSDGDADKADYAEDFADGFAGALLFPEAKAKAAFSALKRCGADETRRRRLFAIADHEVISPYTVLMEVNNYARHIGEQGWAEPKWFHQRLTRFNQGRQNISATLLGTDEAEPRHYIRRAGQVFRTPFFGVLSEHLRTTGQGYGYVQAVMDIPLLDAHGIHAALT